MKVVIEYRQFIYDDSMVTTDDEKSIIYKF